MPIAYISDEAHYSNVRLTYVQNIEVRVVKSDINGRMIPEELEKVLDPSHPAFGQRLGINTVHERILISLPFACLEINDIIFSPVDFAAFASGTNDIVEIGSITAIGPCKKQARGLFYYEQESLTLRDPETLK